MPVKFTFTNPLAKTWLLIHQCHRLLIRAENAAFVQVGLTTRKHAVLFALRNLKNPVTVTDVARWLDRNPNGISMLIDRMVKDGLVNRIKDLPDRRSARLEITPKGKKAITAGNKLTRKVYKQIFAGISNKDFIKISTVLERVRFKSLDYLELEYTKEEMQMLKDQSSQVARYLSQGQERDEDD
jgi:DNA-binding MarR family transcriptional regulator